MRIRLRRRLVAGFLLCLGALAAGMGFDPAPLRAQPLLGEHVIEMYRRDRVHADKTVTVTQFIRVLSEGDKIKWGLERRLRTSYRDGQIKAHYDIIDVRRDGHREPFRVLESGDEIAIMIGDPAVALPPGEHRYCISYRYGGNWPADANMAEVELSEDFWNLPIAALMSEIISPPGSHITMSYAVALDTHRDYSLDQPRHDVAVFHNLRPFHPGEDFKVRVIWEDPVEWPDLSDDKSYDECEIPIG